MKKQCWIALLLTVLLCGAAAQVCAEERYVFTLPTADGSTNVYTDTLDGEPWLFLPSFAQLDKLSAEGCELEWWDTEPDENGLWYVDVYQGEDAVTVNVMRSANLRTVFLFSDDPENRGRTYIEDCPDHENEASASIAIVDTEGRIDHFEKITALRGRGNGTWGHAKRPYQLKLENRADLLDTGDERNQSRTWLLLAEAVEATILHNRITSDLAKELGVSAMDNEHVDLYYDGEYRGTYLLSEKVQVGSGRVEIMDYDALLKKWNSKVGQRDLEALPAAEAVNRYGDRFTYIDGIVEDSRPGVGAFFVEMESSVWTLSDRCYFALDENTETVYALKNPENASQNMVRYVSERLHEARETLRGGGVNPQNGRTMEDDFDVDAFVRTALLQEFAYNIDGYNYSSSFFVLPAGETRFEPGPAWDYDLAYRYFRKGQNGAAVGFKERGGWLIDFYSVPAFFEQFKKVYLEELYPLVQDVLLGDGEGTYLRSLNAWQELLSPSVTMNTKRWSIMIDHRLLYGDTYEEEMELLRSFLKERSEWLYRAVHDVQPGNYQHLPLWMNVSFTNPDDSVQFYTVPWQELTVEVLSTQQLTQATEDAYALWQVEAAVRGGDGRSLEGCSVVLNGTPLTAQLQADGSLLIRAQYEDESYRPVDYYGQDVGLIYQYDKYIADYPEIAQACGYDEQAVMDFFFDEGMYEGQAGNGLFRPKEVARLIPHVRDYLYDDWYSYYWEFLEWGYEADWMDETNAYYLPKVTDAPLM